MGAKTTRIKNYNLNVNRIDNEIIYPGVKDVFENRKICLKAQIIGLGIFLDFTCDYGILETLQTYQEYTRICNNQIICRYFVIIFDEFYYSVFERVFV